MLKNATRSLSINRNTFKNNSQPIKTLSKKCLVIFRTALFKFLIHCMAKLQYIANSFESRIYSRKQHIDTICKNISSAHLMRISYFTSFGHIYN